MSTTERTELRALPRPEGEETPRDDAFKAWLSDRLAPLRGERDNLRERVVALKEEALRIDAEIAVIDKVLRAADIDQAKKQPPKRTSKAVTMKPDAERYRQVVQLFIDRPGEKIATPDVAAQLGISSTSARRILLDAKDRELLRAAGLRENPTGRDAQLFAALPDIRERYDAILSNVG